MNNSRLILFDIDGTLVWTRGAGRASTHAAMLEVFGTVSGLESHEFGGKTDWLTLTELLLEEGYSHADIEQHMPLYERVVQRHLAQIISGYQIEPCPAALSVVQTLREREDTLLGLVTGNVSTTAPIKLMAAGFDPAWFPVGAYGSEALYRDNLPALALERAIVHWRRPLTPEQVVVIGDTPADIACARFLGAVAIAVATGFSTREALTAARPDYLLDDLTGLLDVLETI